MTNRDKLRELLIDVFLLDAGEFRFDGTDHSDDGRLDVHAFADAGAYVRGFVTAWRRHLGKAVAPAPLRRVAALSATFAISSSLTGAPLRYVTMIGLNAAAFINWPSALML